MFWVRKGWRKLISMRTALVLLFLLAVASVPGSLLPQRPLNPTNVTQYLADHGAWGHFLDTLGFFDVFGSVWFAAIYLLLFVSLIGCLVPRIRVHVRALRTKPLPAPKHLTRLPESSSFETTGATADVAARARRALGRRWRAVVREEKGGAVAVSAEKGYSRESGNIVFHVSLLVALVLIAVGRLFHYEGSVLVTEGHQICNTVSAYDNWRPGRVAADGGISPAPFCVTVDNFTAKYLDTGEPTSFASDISYSAVRADGSDGPSRTDALRVNHPLRLGGDRLYLISHGYTPVVTVTLPSGRTYTDYDGSPFIPQDSSTYLSEGVFALKDTHDIGSSAARTDIGIQGLFAPTPVESSPGVYTSVAPQAKDPVLGIFVYQGDLNDSSGQAKSVYAIDTSKMTKTGAANLRIGQTSSFPNGVSVRFDGYKQWVALQVSHDPTQQWLLIAAITMVAGLIGSLAVRRRRVWVRVTSPAGGPTLVTVGGLARSDSGNFGEEFGDLVARLRRRARPTGRRRGPPERARRRQPIDRRHDRQELDMAVSETLAGISDDLFKATVATYALAMVAFTAEYAFGRRGHVARTSGPGGAAARDRGGGVDRRFDPGRHAARGPVDARAARRAPDRARGERQPAGDRIGRTAVGLLAVGALRAPQLGHHPRLGRRPRAVGQHVRVRVGGRPARRRWRSSARWCKVPQIRHLGGFVMFPVLIVMFLAGTVLYARAQTLVPALQSYWLAIHVSSVACAEGLLMTSAVVTVLYLVRQHADRRVAAVRAVRRARCATNA